MTLEERVNIIEKNLDALIKRTDKNALYMSFDINSTRQSVANVTPKTFTKTAYIDDTEIVFTNVPKGNLSVYADNLAYRIERTADMVRITFEALSEPKNITISIL